MEFLIVIMYHHGSYLSCSHYAMSISSVSSSQIIILHFDLSFAYFYLSIDCSCSYVEHSQIYKKKNLLLKGSSSYETLSIRLLSRMFSSESILSGRISQPGTTSGSNKFHPYWAIEYLITYGSKRLTLEFHRGAISPTGNHIGSSRPILFLTDIPIDDLE